MMSLAVGWSPTGPSCSLLGWSQPHGGWVWEESRALEEGHGGGMMSRQVYVHCLLTAWGARGHGARSCFYSQATDR